MTKQDDQSNPPLPKSVAGYRVTRMLGEGGMSVVYAAMQREPKRMVALKVLKGASFPPSALRRFKREIEILGKLRHPGIAQVYDAGTWDDGSGAKPYFAMEYIPGCREFTDYLDFRKASMEKRLKLFVRVCAAVDHGHQRKIVHRDLKPGNILVDENGDVKIIDYGVARVSEVEVNSQTMHTEAGRLVGTVQYMAPEQVDMAMQDIDGRCDVYALGVLLYQICTGCMPHELEGQPIFEAMRTIREDVPQAPRHINTEIDRDLDTIICKCLEKERARRYSRAGELGQDILRYLRDEPIKARRASPMYRAKLYIRRHRIALYASACVAAALVIAALAIIFLPTWVDSQREEKMQETLAQEQAARVQAESERDEALKEQPPLQWLPTEPYVLRGLSNRVLQCITNSAGTLCCAITNTSVGIWTLPDGKRWTGADTGDLKPARLAMSKLGDTLAVAGKSELLCIDLATGGGHRWTLRTEKPEGFAVSEDGQHVAVSFSDFSLSLYTNKGQQVGRTTSTSGVYSVLASAHGLLAGVSEGRVTVWRINNGLRVLKRITVSDQVVNLAIVRAEGSEAIVYMMTEAGTLLTCSVEGDGEVRRQTLVAGPVKQAEFDPDGQLVLIVENSSMSIWDLADQTKKTPSMPLSIEEGPYALGPGGTFYVHGVKNGTVSIVPMK